MSDLFDRQSLIDAFDSLDLIDRQAATNSLVRPRVKDPYDQYWTGRNDQYDTDVSALQDMPSAEPERKKGRWIPCSERLPEKFRRVLCTIQDGEQLYVSLGAFIRHTDAPGNPDFRVVAWMPLPEEPYKEEE